MYKPREGNNSSPLVSVVMPTYNHAQFIGEAISSVLNQTYQNLELIIIDNFSKDNTEEVIKNFIKNDHRIKYEKFSNNGIIAASRNQGIKRSLGEYIAFIDSDDLWLPKKLEKQIGFLEKNKDIFLLYSKCIVQRDGRQLAINPPKPKSGYIFKDLFLHFNIIGSPTAVMRNRKNAYFFDEDKRLVSVEDYALWMSVSYKEKVSFVDEPLAIYRIHSNGMSSGAFQNFKKCGLVLKKHSHLVSKTTMLKGFLNFYSNLIFVGIMVILIKMKRVIIKGINSIILFIKNIAKKACKAGRLFIFEPRMFFKKVYSNLRSLYPISKFPLRKNIQGVIFDFDFGYDPAIKHMYTGAYEIQTVQLMKKFLREGDTFIDIGANIGYLSTIAAGIVGKRGQVHSFEPVPKHFSRLQNTAYINKGHNIKVNQCALGLEEGTVKISITNLPNIGWNTIVPGFMSQDTVKECIDVPVCRFDNYTLKNSLRNVSLIKIDTEGFEFPVLQGFSGFFENASVLPIIICEVAPEAYPLLGYKPDQLTEYMRHYNYEAFDSADTTKKVNISELKETTNVLFIPKELKEKN